MGQQEIRELTQPNMQINNKKAKIIFIVNHHPVFPILNKNYEIWKVTGMYDPYSGGGKPMETITECLWILVTKT